MSLWVRVRLSEVPAGSGGPATLAFGAGFGGPAAETLGAGAKVFGGALLGRFFD